MFIDAFMGFNEVPLAKFRINYLSEFIDRTIVLESKLTHSGIPKPLFFKEWIRTEMNLNEKIEVIEVDLSQIKEGWQRERFSRQYLYEYIISNYPDSKFILSDCDEIPSKEQMKELQTKDTYMKFRTITYFRRANFKVAGKRNENWNRGVFGITNLPYIVQAGRFSKLPLVNSSSPGGHFSYLDYQGDSISKKLESFAHQELNLDFLKSKEFNEFCNKYSLAHVGGARHSGFGLLSKLRFEDMTSIQKSLYGFEAKFFDFEYCSLRKAPRIAASIIVSAAINNPRGGDLIFETFVKKNKKVTRQSIKFIFIELYYIFLRHLIALVK